MARTGGLGRLEDPATSHEKRRPSTLPLQPHLHHKHQPAQRALPPHRGLVEAGELPGRPLGHVDGEGLDEAPGHVDAVAGEDELEVPEGADDGPGRAVVGQLARFDLRGDDGVEVFELGGGEGGGDEGGGPDEAGDSDRRGRGPGDGGAGP